MVTERELRRAWKRGTARIWQEIKEELELPQSVPPRDREKVDSDFEEDLGERLAEACRLGEGEEALAELLDEYRERAKQEAERFAYHVQCILKTDLPPAKASRRKERPGRSKPEEEYRLRHRRRVLEFVGHREVPLVRLLEGSFDTGGRTIDWKRLASEWNRAHPKDPLKPETLKVYYYRARRDERVRETYLADLRRLWEEWSKRLTWTLETLAPGGRGMDSIFVEFTEPLPASPEESRIFGWPPGKKVAWAKFTGRYPPKVAAAYGKAARVKCVLVANTLAFPRDTMFCQRRACRGCRVYRALRDAPVLRIQPEVLWNPQRLAELRAELEREPWEKFRVTQREKAAPSPGPRSPNAKRTTPSRRSRS